MGFTPSQMFRCRLSFVKNGEIIVSVFCILNLVYRDGTSVRVTERGVAKVQGIFISRLVDGGLAESTGLLGVNDEVGNPTGIAPLNH